MSDSRTPRERLDALLAGLEDEVLRADWARQHLAEESVATENVGDMRASIESLIHARTGAAQRQREPLHDAGDGTKGAKAKVTHAMERVRRWAGVEQDGRVASAEPRVRMAFSGEPSEEVGQTARNATRRQRGKPDAAGNEG